MDIVRIQSLLSEGRVADLSTLNGDDIFFQVGVYQKGNRRRGSGNLNSYAPAVFSLDQLLGVIPIPVVKEFKYAVGEYVPEEGGVIAHRWWSTTAGGNPTEGSVQNYLVIALKDLSSVWEYSNVLSSIGSAAGSQWDGMGNTTAIVSQVGSTTGAAVECNNWVAYGQNDWYLPALQELAIAWYNYINITRGLNAGSGDDFDLTKTYWTSTELVTVTPLLNSSAFTFAPQLDRYNAAVKSTALYVRPMRKFSI